MLSVDVEKILPVTEARDKFNQIVDEVEGSDSIFVLTKNGKPAAVVCGINHLEKLTGKVSVPSVQDTAKQPGQPIQPEPQTDISQTQTAGDQPLVANLSNATPNTTTQQPLTADPMAPKLTEDNNQSPITSNQ